MDGGGSSFSRVFQTSLSTVTIPTPPGGSGWCSRPNGHILPPVSSGFAPGSSAILISEPPQLASFEVTQQWLFSELSLDVRPHPVSKVDPRHPNSQRTPEYYIIFLLRSANRSKSYTLDL